MRSLIIVAILLNSPFYSSPSFAQTVVDRLEAVVNGSVILLSDVTHFRKTLGLRSQLDPLFSGTRVAAEGAAASDQSIVEFLLNENLILQNFPVKDTEVEQEVESIQSNNNIGREQLKQALKQQNYRYEDYYELIRRSTAKRKLIDRDIVTKVRISDDDVKNYFYNQSNMGGSPSAFRLRIITISPENYKSPEATHEMATKAMRAIRSGESFEEVAKRFSDDPSAAAGGDLGFVTPDEVNPVIARELKKLKVGQTSGILGDKSSAYFILKLADVRSTQEEKLKKSKEEIRGKLTTAEYLRQIDLWIERERQKAYVHTSGEPSIPRSAAPNSQRNET